MPLIDKELEIIVSRARGAANDIQALIAQLGNRILEVKELREKLAKAEEAAASWQTVAEERLQEIAALKVSPAPAPDSDRALIEDMWKRLAAAEEAIRTLKNYAGA